MKKLRFVLRYITYWFKSTNERGVHSPFVFDLVTNVVYVKADYNAYAGIEKIRRVLLNSDKKISVTDFGAGAPNKNATDKKISDITQASAKTTKYAQLLFRLVNRFQPLQVLELGTSLGISTAYLASANSKTHVITIEGDKNLAEEAKQHFKKLGLRNIEQVVGNADQVLPLVLKKCDTLNFVFFDANHRKEATLNYFNLCVQKANEYSVFVIDDIYWSDEMMEAWSEIKNRADVMITVDLFFMGLVFFRKDQAKQHFMIRF